MFFQRRTRLSSQTITAISNKLVSKTMRDAKKKIKKGEIIDSHSLATYLNTIDSRFTYLKADIANSTRVKDYSQIRGKKVAETRQLIDFFDQDYLELESLARIVAKKAEQAQRVNDLRQNQTDSMDLSDLKKEFNSIIDRG